MNVDPRATPLTYTIEFTVKLDPLTNSVVTVPASTLEGETELRVIVPPPELIANGSALLPLTDTLTDCAVVRQEAGITAVTSPEFTRVVLTVHTLPKARSPPDANPDPNTLSVNAAELTGTLEGEREVSVGTAVTFTVPEFPSAGSCT